MSSAYWLDPIGRASVGRQEAAASWTSTRDAGPRAMSLREARVARAFYRDALCGRQVWPTDGPDASGSLWFLVGLTLIEVSSDARLAATPIVLEVDDAYEVAERCWDAGFSVMVDEEEVDGRASLSVVDPFGRRIALVSRETTIGSGRDRGAAPPGAVCW